MKVKKKVITDQCGSASQTRAIIREVLWGLVSKIDSGYGENDDFADLDESVAVIVAKVDDDVIEESILPVQFGSKNKRKRKGERQNSKNSNKKQYTGLTSTLAIPKYNGTLLEENVYVMHTGEYAGAIIRIMGVSSLLPCGSHVVGHVLRKCENDSSATPATVVEIARTSLRVVPMEERHEAHKLVQVDEQCILTKGMPAEVHLKYWDQRYRLMSLFDQGVRLDAESWYSITPEAVAKHVTSSCIGRARELRCEMNEILDCFSGCGGNTIPFAAMARHVVSVDLDPVKLSHLRHNCGVYGADLSHVDTVCAEVYQLLSCLIPADQLARIRERYEQILKDTSETNEAAEDCGVESSSEGVSELFRSLSPLAKAPDDTGGAEASSPPTKIDTDVLAHVAAESDTSIAEDQLALCREPDLIILSPPWGGPDYLNAKTYDLYTMLTSGCGLYMAMLAAAIAPNLLFLLPVNTSEEQVQYIADVVQMPYVIEYVQINNSPKVMAIYMGSIVAKKQGISASKLATNVGTQNNHTHFHSTVDH